MVQAILPNSTPFYRRKLIEQIFGYSRSTIYRRINMGLFPRPIHIGQNSSAWPSHEIDAISKALIAGQSDDQIKALVESLHADRKA